MLTKTTLPSSTFSLKEYNKIKLPSIKFPKKTSIKKNFINLRINNRIPAF